MKVVLIGHPENWAGDDNLPQQDEGLHAVPGNEMEDPPTGADTIRTTYRLAGQIVAVQTKVGTTGTFYFTWTDHLGNIVALSQGSSHVANSLARFDPFGNHRMAAGSA